MTLQEAIVARHSVRQYQEKPLEASVIERLNEEIALCNREGKLHIQLVFNEPKAFAGGMAKYGKFSGVSNYLAMVGPKGADEAIGYYGERLVLLAQTLGLNSCWVGLTFKKQPDQYTIAAGEKLHCVIALGYGATQGVQHPMRPMEKFLGTQTSRMQTDKLPDWFRRGLEAALLAPTAVNQQKFEFELIDDHTVAARARFSMVGWAKLDLGIVKYNFEVAAGKENFNWR
ncbi:MAG: nitroreductase [Bacteroidales bacterium]|nr:nitroreductase [Bacteroidales bacterium]